ncbi:hypothetical protein T4B_10628 [Trichinella pseudospiralis]|uniref:Uncharacterized protein n=1 Tax=Trichinella pseudospiralis TaxID=6337 RepID=A0A0V1HEK9_TRIPS|nr:hypothetical protein T4B_10628 [Trichinella pseudospiralis]
MAMNRILKAKKITTKSENLNRKKLSFFSFMQKFSVSKFKISIEISRKFSSRFLKLSNNFYDLLRFLLVDRFKRPRAISLCI